MSAPFRLTIIHPCIGRRPGQRYMRTWQMEPLPCAVIAALCPPGVRGSFFDDRMEAIPFGAPADLVALSVETYTARRAYQIASEYRRRGVPVVMGGFHATLCPDEVARYADAVVVGEAEALWAEVIDDFRAGRPKRRYTAGPRPEVLRGCTPDRSIYGQRRYLPLGLVEVGRGCEFGCEFCAVQAMFRRSYRPRDPDEVLRELYALRAERRPKLYFFVDDNFIAHPKEAKAMLRRIARLNIRWVSQASINMARDEELLDLLQRSGCAGLLVGFESMEQQNLRQMGKGVNTAFGGFEGAMAALRRHRIRLYGTFLFGYDADTPQTFERALDFAQHHALYMAAFNHVTPFPGTPLYRRLEAEGRLLHERWWLDPGYSYNMIPFAPAQMEPEQLHQLCLATRRKFFAPRSILRRSLGPANRADWLMWRAFFPINAMHWFEVDKRDHHPLGDQSWRGELLEVGR